MLPKKIFKSLDNVTKKLWFTLPLPILAYPIYLWSRSRWKKGSHFHPHRDLFVPNERKDVITSTICWTAVVSLLAGLSFVMGSVQLLKLYVIPYLVSTLYLLYLQFLHDYRKFDLHQSVVRKKFQLVGVTAMLLVCKYEEGYVPVVDDLIMIFDKAYSRKEILDMEKLMVNTLQFNLSVPTSYVFMRRFLKSGQSDKKLELLSFFKIELCLVECEMLRFPPSLLAAAAVLKAQCTLNGRRECAKLMVIFHQKAGTGKLTGVHMKYSTSKYGYAAKVEPAAFLIDSEFLWGLE